MARPVTFFAKSGFKLPHRSQFSKARYRDFIEVSSPRLTLGQTSRLCHQVILFRDARRPARRNAVVLDGGFKSPTVSSKLSFHFLSFLAAGRLPSSEPVKPQALAERAVATKRRRDIPLVRPTVVVRLEVPACQTLVCVFMG